MDEYGLGVVTALGFDQAVSTTRLLLKAQGFRILSEMPAPTALAGSHGRNHLSKGSWRASPHRWRELIAQPEADLSESRRPTATGAAGTRKVTQPSAAGSTSSISAAPEASPSETAASTASRNIGSGTAPMNSTRSF